MTNGWMTGIFGAPNLWALDRAAGKLTYYGGDRAVQSRRRLRARPLGRGRVSPNALQYNLVSARNDIGGAALHVPHGRLRRRVNLFWAQCRATRPAG